MKINKVKVVICIIVLISIIGSIVYLKNRDKKENKENETIDLVYEKITMITNLRLGISNYDSMNPHVSKNKDILQINNLIFEPLLEITKDYNIKNCLSKEYSKISDKSYIIKLKDNIKWQTGSDFSAEDVKFTIDKIKSEKKSIYLENVKEIENVEIIDNKTIRINLKKEIPFFEYNLIFPIISKEQYNKEKLNSNKILPSGTGKYKIQKIEENKIELSKNQNWREIEKEDLNIKTIIIYIYENTGEIYNAFRLGNIDFIQTNNKNYEDYVGSIGYSKKEFPGREYEYMAFNCKNEILQDSKVRKAISKIIDKEKILIDNLENKEYISNFPLDYGSYLINENYSNNSIEQKEIVDLLKDSGWKYEYGLWSKEINGITRTLNFELSVLINNKTRIEIAKNIKKQLEDIGINITIKELSKEEYEKILKEHNYEILLTGIYNGYSPDLTHFLGNNNLANYENEEIIEILKDIKNINKEDVLKEKYKKLLEIWENEVPYMGIYRNRSYVIYNSNLRGNIEPNNYNIYYNFSNWYRQ